jgi:hypothetical protein
MRGNATFWLGLLFVSLPLLIPIAAFVAVRYVQRKWAKISLVIFGVLAAAVALVFFAGAGSYGWALYLESRWSPAHPKSRTEMESYLSLYSTREIQPAESPWGRDHVLRAGDKMIQYMILWGAPLDVVYDRDEKVVAIYTSYE